MSNSLKAFWLMLLTAFSLPLVVKPAAAIVGAELVAEAAATATQVVSSEERVASKKKTPAAKPPAESKPVEQKPIEKPATPDASVLTTHHSPLTTPPRCCPDCTCEGDCHCEYPGQCVLRKAGKHIVWIHDPATKAWRGYASPQCRDVREVDPNYRLPTYNAMGQLLPPRTKAAAPLRSKAAAPQRTLQRRSSGGCCGSQGCRLN